MYYLLQNRVPVWQQKKNFLAVLDKPSKSELENFLFAHIHSDMHSGTYCTLVLHCF